ncbi:hypothetical protein [Streptomyces sp. MH13]|uniref:hypothetical protein n=1 Tax=unclassified Streptomyces TaxID=2593676 RepID=UPI003CF89B77
MPPSPRRKKTLLITAGTMVAVSALVSTHIWQNTNVLGSPSFCDQRVESRDAQGALNSSGRVSEGRLQSSPGEPEFTCVIERTSRFLGNTDQQVTLTTANEDGPFPYTTHVWKNPGARSYFKGETTGAVTPTGGYVVLPKSCWDKVGNIRGTRVIPPDDDGVSAVEATVTKGQADPEGLALLLAHAAQRVAADAGCATPPLEKSPELAAPDGVRTTDVGKVCGLPGFSLPDDAVLTGVAEPGQEQISKGTKDVWACDLTLAGSAGAAVSFTATSDQNMVDAVLQDTHGFRELPNSHGIAAVDQAVLHCAEGDVYFAAHWNREYASALSDNHDRVSNVRGNTFDNFVASAADLYSCPDVTLAES